MVIFASSAVVLSLYAVGLEAFAATKVDEDVPTSYELPINVQADASVRQAIGGLLARSRTLRQQCARIAAARHVRVAIETVTPSTFDALMRARSTARRYDSGLRAS